MSTATCIVRLFAGPRDDGRGHPRQVLASCVSRLDRMAEIEFLDDPDADVGAEADTDGDLEFQARVILSSPYRDSETIKDCLYEGLLKSFRPESDGQIEVELTDDL
jgi:hypothetical protein